MLLAVFCQSSTAEGAHCTAGGGISVNNATSIEVLDSDFVNNTATSGGGMYVMGCTLGVSLVTNNFVGNEVSHSGGGLFVAQCSGGAQGCSSRSTCVLRHGQSFSSLACPHCRVLHSRAWSYVGRHPRLAASMQHAPGSSVFMSQGNRWVRWCNAVLFAGLACSMSWV